MHTANCLSELQVSQFRHNIFKVKHKHLFLSEFCFATSLLVGPPLWGTAAMSEKKDIDELLEECCAVFRRRCVCVNTRVRRRIVLHRTAA